MCPAWDAADAVLVIRLKTDLEQVGQIGSILERIGIQAKGPIPGCATDPPGHVSVRIPADRLIEALLTLEDHGFKRVRGYPEDAAPVGPGQPPRTENRAAQPP